MSKHRIFLTCTIFTLFFVNLISNHQVFALENKTINYVNLFECYEYGNLTDMPLEMVISRRISVHYEDEYSNATVPWELVSKVLWAAYGYSWRARTVPSLSDYPILIYICNETAAYKFVPENRKLTLWKEGDYRDLSGGYTAPIQLYIAFDTNLCQDVDWANAEAGCPIQNIYLMANALNLGTVCLGGPGINREYINEELALPEHEKVLYKMPLGYPLPPNTDYQNLVPTSRPSSLELPELKESTASFSDALQSVFSSHEWSENPVTKQQLSQVLWASYGFSYLEDKAPGHRERHRTVPSAGARYPMRIYAANSSGVYEYLPKQHTLTTLVADDRRLSIAIASGNAWASSAPLIIALAWNDTNILTVPTTYIEVGLITQNVYLESAAWGLIADWGKANTDEEAMRQSLGLTGETNLHPVSIITIGHPSTYCHKAEWNQTIYPVETKSNSTILNFAFDQPNRKISFNVSGPSDTLCFCNITIPNTLLWGDFTVLVDGNPPTTLAQRDNATHTSLHFTFELLSNLNVQIIGEYAIPEFQTWASMLLIFFILTFIILIYERKNSGHL
jgi:SagB-type dehydrogenase family enzyme